MTRGSGKHSKELSPLTASDAWQNREHADEQTQDGVDGNEQLVRYTCWVSCVIDEQQDDGNHSRDHQQRRAEIQH